MATVTFLERFNIELGVDDTSIERSIDRRHRPLAGGNPEATPATLQNASHLADYLG
jgi:hypothetical protein